MEKDDYNILLDGHVHTLACGHAYNTITEMARAAKEKGLEAICWLEHGPKMYGGTNNTFFRNLRVIPEEIEGVRVLKGIEANILNPEGKIDAQPSFKDGLEVVGASLHSGAFRNNGEEIDDYTDILLKVMQDPAVDYLCHLGNPKFPIDKRRVVEEAKKQNKMIEINNSSFFVRKGSKDNCLDIAELCKEYEVPVILGSDAHWADSVGDFTYALKALKEVGMPEELIVNTNPQILYDYLKAKGKKLGGKRSDEGVDLFD